MPGNDDGQVHCWSQSAPPTDEAGSPGSISVRGMGHFLFPRYQQLHGTVYKGVLCVRYVPDSRLLGELEPAYCPQAQCGSTVHCLSVDLTDKCSFAVNVAGQHQTLDKAPAASEGP